MQVWTVVNQAGPWAVAAILGYLKWQSDRKNVVLTAEAAERTADTKDKEVDSHSANETATTTLSVQDKYQVLIDRYYQSVGDLSAKVLLLENRVSELERKLVVAEAENLVLRKRDENCAEVERVNILLKSKLKDAEEALRISELEANAAGMGQAAAEAGLRVAKKMLDSINPSLAGDMQRQIDEMRAQMHENRKRIEQQERNPAPPHFG